MSRVLTSSLFAAVAAFALLPSAASADCDTCYTKVVTPPQYRVVDRTVMVSPGGVVVHRTPDRVATVSETVQVSPGGKGWQRSVNAYGQETLCEVDVPAQYTTAHRHVVVPGTTYARHIAPTYGVTRTVEMVSPGGARWVASR